VGFVPADLQELRTNFLGSDDEEDETAELMRELEKIKRERAEQREREVRFVLLPEPASQWANIWA
jgi:hypothetical protein